MNRHIASECQHNALPAPRSAEEVGTFLAELMADIRAGRVDPKLGGVLGYLGTALLKAIEVNELEKRLSALEQSR